MTTIGRHETVCDWSGHEPGRCGFVVSISVYGAPSYVGKPLLAAAKAAAEKANRAPGGLGLVTSGNPRRGNYFEGEAHRYGSPLPHGEPMLLQISVACQVDALSGGLLTLGHIASAVYAGRGY